MRERQQYKEVRAINLRRGESVEVLVPMEVATREHFYSKDYGMLHRNEEEVRKMVERSMRREFSEWYYEEYLPGVYNHHHHQSMLMGAIQFQEYEKDKFTVVLRGTVVIYKKEQVIPVIHEFPTDADYTKYLVPTDKFIFPTDPIKD